MSSPSTPPPSDPASRIADSRSGPISSQARPGVEPAEIQSGNELPLSLTSLVGREEDLASVTALLRDERVRLLTLTGPGGVGKTRLALQAASLLRSHFADGIVIVSLAATPGPDLVLSVMAQALGVPEPAGSALDHEVLARRLRDRQMLLVLDNLEHVLASAVDFVRLLESCPGVTMLTTSRVRLGVAGERRYPVAPLALPATEGLAREMAFAAISAAPAVQLLVDRARAIDPAFEMTTQNASTLAAISARLDGLPLAIELAAVRLELLSPEELLVRLDHALPLLTAGPANRPERHRTMRRAIAWSYDLLAPDQQALLRQLAIFEGGATLPAIEAVAGFPEGGEVSGAGKERPLFDRLAALVGASLIVRHQQGGETRFTLLETIREFAHERLVESGELIPVSARHAAWYHAFATEMRRSGTISLRVGLERFAAEHPNVRTALTWLVAQQEIQAALHLAGECAEFWFRHGHIREGSVWLEQLLAADPGPPSAARANALVGLNMLRWPAAARQHARQELAADGTPADGYAGVIALLEEAVRVAQAAGDSGAYAYARLHQGYVAAFRGDYATAAARAAECAPLVHEVPQALTEHGIIWLEAEVAMAAGESVTATSLFQRLLISARKTSDEISLTNALIGLASIAAADGRHDDARRDFLEAAHVALRTGNRLLAGHCLEQAAATVAARGGHGTAVLVLAAVDAQHRLLSGDDDAEIGGRYRRWPEQAMADARAALGATRFAEYWSQGSALSLERAIDIVVNEGEARYASSTQRGLHTLPLTGREREVVRMIVDGKSDKEIALELGISRRTVSNHVSAILGKLGLPSRAAVAARAVRDELI